MGKAPAFQWYPGDWFREPGLKVVDLKVRGAWAELLMMMFDLNPQGILDTSLTGFASALRISPEEASEILWDLHQYEICTLKFYDDESFEAVKNIGCRKKVGKNRHFSTNSDVFFQPDSIFFRVISRRQFREWKARHNDKLRKQKKNGSIKNPDDIPFRFHENSRPISSTSSSIGIISKDIIPGSDDPVPIETEEENHSKHYSNLVSDWLEKLNELAEKFSTLPQRFKKPFNPYQFIQRYINKGYHPEVVFKALETIKEYWMGIKAESPYQYTANLIDKLQKEKEHEGFKRMSVEDLHPDVQAIVQGLSSKIPTTPKKETEDSRLDFLKKQAESLKNLEAK